MDCGIGVCVFDIPEQHEAGPVTLITSLGVGAGGGCEGNADFIYLFLINPTQSRWQLRVEIVMSAVSLFPSLSYHNVTPCIKSAVLFSRESICILVPAPQLLK